MNDSSVKFDNGWSLFLFSLLSGVGTYFLSINSAGLLYLSYPYFFGIFSESLPGISFGIGLCIFYYEKSRTFSLQNNFILFFSSVIGYLLAYNITTFGSIIFPFLSPLIGCYLGSFILANIIVQYWNLDKNNIKKITHYGGILGFIVCIPLTFLMLQSTTNSNNSEFMSTNIYSVLIWQLTMSFVILKTIINNDKLEPKPKPWTWTK